MPARVVDGDAIYLSGKVKKLKPEYRAEYSYLIPLAEANGVFDVDPARIWATAYAYLRDGIDPEWVEELLADLERVDLLRTWTEGGKRWGYWTGIGKSGRLPSKEHLTRYKNLPPNAPPEICSEESVPDNPGLSRPGIGIGLDRIGIGLEPAAQENEDTFNNDGQGEEMKLKDELTRIAANHGAKAGGYKTTWDEIKSLGIAHGTGAVSTDFTAFMEEYHGDDFPKGAVVAYLRYAPDRLVADSAPAAVVSKDPQVTGLVREFTYLSGNKVMFQGRQKVALAELLKEYTPEELTAVFKTYLDSKDLEDPYTLKFVTQNYLDAADGLAYSARKQKQEAEEAKTQRDAAVVKMQEQAELERKQAEEKKAKEAQVFDPLADLLSETDQTVV